MAATAPVDRRHWLGGIGTAVATVGLWLSAGPWGVAAGVATALVWYRYPATYAFAVGQVLLVTTLAVDAPVAAVATAEFGLFAVLAGPLLSTAEPVRTLAAFVVATTAVGAVGWVVLLSGRPLWLAALAVAVVGATAAYGLHRYERVSLGLVADERGADGERPVEEAT